MAFKKAVTRFRTLVCESLEQRRVLSFSFVDFANADDLMLVGNASITALDRLRLTPNERHQRGAAWFHERVSVADGFETIFDFEMSGGSDGIAFVIQNESLSAMGASGSGLGYHAMTNSVAVEFDTQLASQLGDPSESHISVHTRGVNQNDHDESASLGSADTNQVGIVLDDGQPHNARVVYEPGRLSIFLDGSQDALLDVSIDLAQTLNLDQGSAFVGFTGATGWGYQQHEISSWLHSAIDSTIVVQSDQYELDEDSVLVIDAAQGVLANDGADLSATLETDVRHGELSLESDGSFVYTPNGHFFGTDTFTYRAEHDGAVSRLSTVTIVVNSQPDSISSNDDHYSVVEDRVLLSGTISPAGVSPVQWSKNGHYYLLVDGATNAEDAIAAAATYRFRGATGHLATIEDEFENGFVRDSFAGELLIGLNDVAGEGDWQWMTGEPFSYSNWRSGEPNNSGNEDFVAISNVVGEWNDVDGAVPPVTSFVVEFSGPFTDSVLENDVNPENQALTAILLEEVKNGDFEFQPDGSFTYAPFADFNGIDTFTYEILSGDTRSNVATVSITVISSNDPPTATDDPNYDVAEDMTVEVDSASGVLANDQDIDSASLSAVLLDDVSHGSLTLFANGSFAYTPDDGFFGTDEFTYIATDAGAESNPATATITVIPVDDPPVAYDDRYEVGEDDSLSTSSFDLDPFADTLVAEMSVWKYLDDGSNQQTAWREADFDDTSWEEGPSELGYGDGDEETVVSFGENENNKYPTTYFRHAFDVENVDRLQELSMNLKWDDGIAVYLNGTEVQRENLAPNAPFDAYANSTTQSESAYHQRAIPMELLLEGVNVLAAEVHQANPTSSDISFDLQLSAERLPNPAGVLDNDTDVDGDDLTTSLINPTSNGILELEEDGSFVYTPDEDFSGTDSFTYRVTDPIGLTDTATVTIDVTEVNDPPIAVNVEYLLVNNETIIVMPGVLENDSDQEGQTLTARIMDQPTFGSLSFNEDGSFEYIPGNDFLFSDSFSYVANDGESDSEIAVVTILADIPTIEVGKFVVLPDAPNQIVDVFVSGGHDVTGVNIRAQIGDGTGPMPEPVFQAVDFNGGIWDGATTTGGGGPVAGAEQFVQANVQFSAPGVSTTADGQVVRLLVDTTGFSEGTFDLLLKNSEIGADTDFVGSPAHIHNGTITIANSNVVGRHIFYNNSYFDGLDSESDDLAIAPDKTALLPGETASFANYISTLNGITGVMVDVVGLTGTPSEKDFDFKVGNDDDPANWVEAPERSSVTVREDAGVDGSDRVTIIWPGRSIQKQWLQVTMLPTADTGLPTPDVFYFGNAVGDAGDSPNVTFVDGTDFALARDNPRNFLNRAPIDFPYDYNRDSFVDGFDLAIARDNGTNFLTALKLITPGPVSPGLPLWEPMVVNTEVEEQAAEVAVERRFIAVDTVFRREQIRIDEVRDRDRMESLEELLAFLVDDRIDS